MSEFKSNNDNSEEAWALGIGLGICILIIAIVVAIQSYKKYTEKQQQPIPPTEVPANPTVFHDYYIYTIAA